MVEERRSKVDTNAEFSHRLDMLESGQEKLEERTVNTDKRVELLDKHAINAEERLDSMNEVHVQTMATLSKMQVTLEGLNEVLTTFNTWKYTKKGIRSAGEVLIWCVKVGIAVAMLWTALNFNMGHSGSAAENHKPAITNEQKIEKEKSLLEKFEELSK